MEQPQEQTIDLIIRCLTGEAEGNDMENLRRWTEASEENMRYYRQMQDLWTSSTTSESLSRFDATAAFEQFKKRIAEVQETEVKNSRAPELQRSHSWFYMPVWARWVAVILIIAGCFWRFYRTGQTGIEKQFADITVEAPTGSRTVTTLPDGTRVTLNAGSRLTYSQGFGISDRTVSLSGEGFFEVRHNADLPFSVSTDDLKVNDLGTKFNLRDYPESKEAEVVLTEGSVSLDNLIRENEAVTMKPGDRAVLSKETGKLTVSGTGGEADVAWTTGKLVLNGKSIQAIARELEHAYGVKVTIASNRLSACRFFGRFDTRTLSLREVLDALAATDKLHYSISGKSVKLY